MQAPGKLYYSIEPVPEGGAGLVLVEDQAAAEGELGTLRLGSATTPRYTLAWRHCAALIVSEELPHWQTN